MLQRQMWFLLTMMVFSREKKILKYLIKGNIVSQGYASDSLLWHWIGCGSKFVYLKTEIYPFTHRHHNSIR